MNTTQFETTFKKLVKSLKKDSFIFDFLFHTNYQKQALRALKRGNVYFSKFEGEVSWRNNE